MLRIRIAVATLTALLSTTIATTTRAAEDVVVTALRGNTSIEAPAVNTTIYDSETIRRSGAATLSEFLGRQSGIQLQDLFGIGGISTAVDLGAFGPTGALNTVILLNGRRLNDVDQEGANLAAIPLAQIERIEVMHGVATVLYGDNAASGAINIVTKTGSSPRPTRAAIEAGSFDTYAVSASGGTNQHGTDFFGGIDRFRSHGYRDRNAVDTSSLTFDASKLISATTVGIRASGFQSRAELPRPLGQSDFFRNPTKSDPPLQSSHQKQWNADLYLLSETCSGELSFRRKLQEGVLYGYVSADLSTLSATPRCGNTFGPLTLTYGADVYRSELRTHADFSGLGQVNDSQATRQSIGVYLNETLTLAAATSATFGARYQQVDQELSNRDITGILTGDNADDELTAFDLTLSHRFVDALRAYIRGASSFRSPVLDDMWGYFDGSVIPLRSQEGRHVEAGAALNLSSDTSLTAQAGRAIFIDEIGFDIVSYTNINLDPTVHETFDVTLRTAPTPRWKLTAGFSYRDARFREGPNRDRRLPEIPRRTWKLGNDVTLAANHVLSLDAMHTADAIFGNDYANAGKPFPNLTVANLAYRYEAAAYSVRVKVNNVTDRRTAASGYYNEFGTTQNEIYSYYPLPERAYYLMLEKTWP